MKALIMHILVIDLYVVVHLTFPNDLTRLEKYFFPKKLTAKIAPKK